ncbi:MAG: ABC-F family ATP-binding cassette domain-containing protein [Bernardetiaceae bacterium]|nr:ABC-F family ATP-binding cassette domain-containing protein [Bernardetiaceae bacterium]
MNILSAENITKSYRDEPLFTSLNFGISQGEKIAIVGVNGAGKSTLMKIMAGLIEPDSGEVSTRQGIKVGYLPQDPKFEVEMTIWEAIFQTENEQLEAIKTYERLMTLEQTDTPEFMKTIETMERLSAWNFESKIREILSKLGIEDTTRSVLHLSGGQRKRVAIAKLLLDEPDLLLLDEPTNHLDLDTIEWLENYLATANTTLLLVTHDRYFLDRICNKIAEINQGNIYRYEGNYAYFLETKAEREASERASTEKARNLMRKELDWIRRQPKARGTKAKYRVDAFEDLKEQAAQKVGHQNIELAMQGKRQGKKILELDGVHFSYENQKIIDNLNYTFKKGDRIGIVGKNGVGKTTFLKILLGEIRPQKGKISPGENTQFGYYSQNTMPFDESMRVIETVQEVAEYANLTKKETLSASQLLTHFLFPPARQYDRVEKLSGGERRRLQLLRVLMRNPNFLIFDEPTNDLDLQTLSVLEEFLESFEGCLLLVSHDRYFMDRLAEHLFVFEGEGQIRDFYGNYSDYRTESEEKEQAQKKQQKSPKVAKENSKTNSDHSKTNNKLSYKERRQLEQLEKEIEALQKSKEKLETWLASGENDFDKIATWSEEVGQIIEQLDEKEMQWLELSEKEA